MRRESWRLRGAGFVILSLAGILAGLVVSVLAVTGIAEGLRDAVKPTDSPGRVAGGRTVLESMTIETSSPGRHPDWPRYTNPSWTVKKGETVVLRIKSFDDGPAPLTGVQTAFDSVEGTIGGTETLDGKVVHSVPNGEISHTFTVVGLGLNVPIPAAPTGGSVTVVARFVAKQSGTFTWQCYAPCGSGSNSMGGAMSVKGYMEGWIRVAS